MQMISSFFLVFLLGWLFANRYQGGNENKKKKST